MEKKVAKRKYPRSKDKQNQQIGEGAAYVSWDSDDPAARNLALASYSDTVQEFSSASVGSRGRDFSDLTTYLSGKPGFNQSDYDWFRPDSATPRSHQEIIAFARASYRRIGLIRNAIDLMGDFACQGIRLIHPNKRIEKFYNDWFMRAQGKTVSERMCNLLFREANVPIRMKTAKLNKQKRLQMQKSVATVDMEAVLSNRNFQKGEIPWQYVFLDPLLIGVVGGQVSNMIGQQKLYTMKLPTSFKREIAKLKNSNNPAERSVLAKLPQEIVKAAESSKGILLPPEKTFMLHYKKDDWQQWADPMTYACFSDLILYEKLKLADKAALDGAVNKIRVWKLGSLDHKLAPTPTAASALGEILGASVGGGSTDIVWGPDIELIESGTDVQRFLGEEKYRPTLMSIYACLGIPPTLTGTFGASGTTNNFISLKTLTERLNYVRNIITDFWLQQIKIVQEAMGFRISAQVEFDFMYLDDPAAMTQLLISLADRNIISDEFVQRNVKAAPSVESNRLSSENKKRNSGKMSEKISPYHAVDKDFALEKIALQTGVVSPTQVGVELEEGGDDKSALEMRQPSRRTKNETDRVEDKEEPTGDSGRPKNSRDISPRKKREYKPRDRASVLLWARSAQEEISKHVNQGLLEQFDKKNMRSLTSQEFDQVERVKFEILCNLDYENEVDFNNILEAMNEDPIEEEVYGECNLWITDASEQMKRRLSVSEIRELRAAFYVYHQENS